ncbi:MAG: hypothetical protein ACR2PO_16625 [Methyloligellaceae bacterium]
MDRTDDQRYGGRARLLFRGRRLDAELGGEVLRQPFDVPGVGHIAIIKDPQGAALGIGTPDSNSDAAEEWNR